MMMFMERVTVTPAKVNLDAKFATLSDLKEFVEKAFKNGAVGTEQITAEVINRRIRKAEVVIGPPQPS